METDRRAPTLDVGRLLDEGRWTTYQRAVVLLAALAIVFDGLDNQLLGVAVPAMMREWTVSRAAFAPILACGMVGMMIGGAVAGMVGDRFGRRVALIGSVLVFALPTVAIAAVDTLLALGTLRFIAGLGLGGALPNAAALASEFVPRRVRPLAVTLTIVCVPLGGTLGALLGGQVLPLFGWRVLFAIGGALPVVVAIVLIRCLPESPRYLARRPDRWPELARVLRRAGHEAPAHAAFADASEAAASRVSLGALFTPELRRDSAALWGAFFSCLLAVYLGFNWIPSMMSGAGLGVAVASTGLAAYNLGGVAGAIAGGWSIGRFGSRVTMLSMAAGASAGALGLATIPMHADADTRLIILMLGLTGGLINAVQTTMYALATNVYPTPVRATGVGSAVSFGRTGAVLSTYAGAWALEAGGSTAFFVFMAFAMAAALGALALVRRHVPGRGSAPDPGAVRIR
jgi:AAHS family 4-hydroxybenzoate transporter-like MFS transporter